MWSMIWSASRVFLGFFVETFFMGVLLRTARKAIHSLQRAFDIDIGNSVFLGQRMGKKGHVLPMEEVEYAVIHVALLGSEFIDSVPQKIRLRTAEFMAKKSEQANGCNALSEGFLVFTQKLIEPLLDRDTFVIVLVEENHGFRHCVL